MKSIQQIFRYTGRSRCLLLSVAATWLMACGSSLQGQSIIILVDAVNDGVNQPAYNQVHKDGMEALHEYEKKALNYQRYAVVLTGMIYKREQGRIEELMEVSDLYSDNQEWKDMFEARLDTTRKNLDSLKVTIEHYPLAQKLADIYDRLKEDIDDAEKKYKQVIEGKGQENMMRTSERNHLAQLAEQQLEKSALTIYTLNQSVPYLRRRFEEGGESLFDDPLSSLGIGF